MAYVACASIAHAQGVFPFEYAAKVVCGKGDARIVVAQVYATTINVHYPSPDPTKTVSIRKKLALTVPPGNEKPGTIFPATKENEQLAGDGAMATDCADLRSRIPRIAQIPFFEGFVVVQSTESLDVVAVYTVPGGIDVVNVPERRLVR